MKRISLAGVILLLSFGLAAWSQQPAPATPQQKEIKKVPMKATAAQSGEEMYVEYCAVCHGKAAKGDGPAASALKLAPTDLTTLTKNNSGKFPSDHVAAVLRFGTETPSHGSKDMPIWGHILATSPTQGTDATMVQLRIRNLTSYIESLQSK
jgi:mono/diheme cytochrome c family protein